MYTGDALPVLLEISTVIANAEYNYTIQFGFCLKKCVDILLGCASFYWHFLVSVSQHLNQIKYR